MDYLFVYEGKLIPVEGKCGVEGKLKSLHIFIDTTTHKMAVRFYAGELKVSTATTTSGKKYHLLNLPYYRVSQLENYLAWFEKEIRNI